MASDKISNRYAISLIETAEDKNLLDKVSEDMELINSTFKTSPQLERVLENPVIKPSVKRNILNEIFKNKVNPESLKFMLFILDKNREAYYGEIINKFLQLRDEKLGIVNVQVKIPYELDNADKENIRKKFEDLLKKKVRTNFEIDEKLIGGFLAKVDDTVYDASFTHQLELLKKQFLHTSNGGKVSANLN